MVRAARRNFFVLVALLGALVPAAARATGHKLTVKVIHAHNKGQSVDPKLAALVKELAALKFTSYVLKDEATFDLQENAVGRMQLPSRQWMTVALLDTTPDGKLRLELEVRDLKFKTTVSLAKGATLAVGGPAFEGGALILAITQLQP